MIGITPISTTIPVKASIVPVKAVVTQAVPKSGFWDIFSSATNSVSNLATSAANTINAVKSNTGIVYNPSANTPPAPVKSNTKKYLIGGGIAVAVACIAYVVFKKKKKS